MTHDEALDRIARRDFFIIAGPCVVESYDLCAEIAERVGQLTRARSLPLVFKASYTKANRLAGTSYHGPGIESGLDALARIKAEFDLPIITDVHESHEVAPAARIADILQIPAFLSRQTALVQTAAASGKWVNIKKGQFLAPEDMEKLVAKAHSDRVMVTERGTSFGYRNLVVDFRSLLILREIGVPVIYDATHSLQQPGAGDGVTTGQPQFVIPMARAAAAVGIDGLFVETHPRPDEALSDAGAMLSLDKMERLLDSVLAAREVATI